MESHGVRSVLELPDPFRSIFNFRYFNSLQSECFPSCFLSDVNMVVSAPTGSGKTVLFELCILRLLSRFLSPDGRFVHVKGTLKTIYIAPSKALVQEKLRHWNQKFGAWGISCLELTGDNDSYSPRNIQEADIILTTPEKFDAVSRYRIKDGGLSFFSDIALLLIDEVHLLNEPRGAALEAIVSRFKMLSCRPEMKSSALAHIRFAAVSATIPNLEDLAEWLMVPPQGMKRFGEEMRPVKLTTKVFGTNRENLIFDSADYNLKGKICRAFKHDTSKEKESIIFLDHFLGYAAAKNDFLFEKRLQNYIFDILMQYSRGKSALVFCSTRKGAQEAAQKISQTAMTFGYSNPFIKTKDQEDRLREASLSCSDKQLQSYILYGVGYHNGALCMKDRNLVESLFLNGDIQIICTTNTLAHGINLPAHTVVIKSTQQYNKEKSTYVEYDRATILQMCGRAGRPPFDDTGLVIIMTRRETVHLYENLLNGCELVESQLLYCMTEHLTAEIVQLTIPDIWQAIEWMKCSYLYVRMKKNPDIYAVEKGISRDRIERHMQDICVKKVNELSRNQMIWTDEDGFLIKPLEPGRLMTKYYLKFNTMKYIMQAPSNCSLQDALHIVCRAEELSWVQLRRNEKKLLNDINMDKDGRLRFHILADKGKKKKRIQTREEKIFVLANDCLTGDPLVHDLSLTQDANSICSNGCRVAKCMKEYFIFRKNYKGALNSVIIAKSLHHKLWDDSPYLLKQLPGIGMVTAKALHSMGITSFESLAEADPRRIEIVAGRKFPFGNHIKESLLSLPPKVEMKIEKTDGQGNPKLAISLTRLTQSQTPKRHYADMIVGLEEENIIIYYEKIRVDDFRSPYHTKVQLSNYHQGKLTVKADLIFEEFIGVDLHQKLELVEEARLGSKRPFSVIHPAKVSSAKNATGKTTPPNKLPKTHTTALDKQPNPRTTTVDEQTNPRKSNKKKKIDDTMPSFKLIDEDSEEDSPGNNTDENDCKIISGSTIFDHIRKKAKNFPVLTTLGSTQFPTPETSKLPSKSIHEEQHKPPGMIETSKENVGYSNHQKMTPCPTSETEHNAHLINEDTGTAVSNNTFTGSFHPQVEETRKESGKLETSFDNFWKRLKMINKHSSTNGLFSSPSSVSSCILDSNPSAGDHNESISIETSKDETHLPPRRSSDLPKETLKDKRRLSPTRTLDLPFEFFFNTPTMRPSTIPPSVTSLPLRTEGRSEPRGDSTAPEIRNTSNNLIGANKGNCSLETEVKTREVESFLGFKSVFSFL